MDQWISPVLLSLAAWILISGVDDLFVDLVWLWQWLRVRVLLLDGFHQPTPVRIGSHTATADGYFRPRLA